MAGEAKFTLKQLVAFIGVSSVISGAGGAGGAITIRTQDALQDERIDQHGRRISELCSQVAEVTRATALVHATVVGMGENVVELKTDTKEVQRLLNKLLGKIGDYQ